MNQSVFRAYKKKRAISSESAVPLMLHSAVTMRWYAQGTHERSGLQETTVWSKAIHVLWKKKVLWSITKRQRGYTDRKDLPYGIKRRRSFLHQYDWHYVYRKNQPAMGHRLVHDNMDQAGGSAVFLSRCLFPGMSCYSYRHIYIGQDSNRYSSEVRSRHEVPRGYHNR